MWCVCVCVCVCLCGGKMLSILLRQGLWLKLGLSHLATQNGQWAKQVRGPDPTTRIKVEGNTTNLPSDHHTHPTGHTSSHNNNEFRLFFKRFICLFYVCEYTVAVFRHTRRGHRIPLQMAVSLHVVAGNCTQDLWKSRRCQLFPVEPSLQPACRPLNSFVA